MFFTDYQSMTASELLVKSLGLIVVGSPFLMFVILGISSLIGQPFGERGIIRIMQTAIVSGLLASLGILGVMIFFRDSQFETIASDDWVHVGHSYHFSMKFVFDRLSVPFVVLTFLLCGTVTAFASRYMHRERGFNRFFVMNSLFVLGMVMTSLSGTIETLFFGWELVGLSSTMLIGFYHERPSPVANGLRVWVVYRLSDAALLMASVVMHHLKGGGDFERFLGGNWPYSKALELDPNSVYLVGALILFAAMGKSALVPFSGWLPRAMEGPTPSSAVFYGALSVHLGAFLLLRYSPILEESLLLSVIVVLVGLKTAGFAAFTGRVQTDIKSALVFASMTQVGIIVAEIGIVSQMGAGWRFLPLIHILGHACLRTMQFLRAPTILHDYRIMENAIGSRIPKNQPELTDLIPHKVQVWLYRLALERGYLDAILSDFIVAPFLKVFQFFDRVERRWTDFLSGGVSREADEHKSQSRSLEDLL